MLRRHHHHHRIYTCESLSSPAPHWCGPATSLGGPAASLLEPHRVTKALPCSLFPGPRFATVGISQENASEEERLAVDLVVFDGSVDVTDVAWSLEDGT
jgi:hypothetical protein